MAQATLLHLLGRVEMPQLLWLVEGGRRRVWWELPSTGSLGRPRSHRSPVPCWLIGSGSCAAGGWQEWRGCPKSLAGVAAVPQEAGGRNHHHRVWLAGGGGHQTSKQQRPGDNHEHG